jgi:hypothetical protein
MNTRLIVSVGAVLLAARLAIAQDRDLTIQNAALIAKWHPTCGHFSLLARPSGRTVIAHGTLSAASGAARIVPVLDKAFGEGQAIEVFYQKENRSVITLFPELPFALIRASLHNETAELLVTNKVQTLSVPVSLNRPAAELKVLGTGGLLALDRNPGSYAWLAVAHPQSRNGMVFGWLTHDRASGVLFSRATGDTARVEAQLDYGRLRVAPSKTEDLETLAVGYFDDARLGLESWADAVAKAHDIKLRPQPAGYCTWYSRPHGGASSEKPLAQLSGFAATNLAPFGFSVVQIDDGWQAGLSTNGPDRNFSTHKPRGPYPSGMKAIADKIKADGLVAGIWFMPFAGTYYDPFFKDRQDWFVKRTDGAPYETAWGGTCLDMTHPGPRAYLAANARRMAQEWGYGYFKMDGLWTGTGTRQQYVNSGYKDDGIGDALFHNPEKTNLEAYRDGLKLVREAAGQGVFFLGCCAPQNMRSYGGAFGLVDAMRIGPDNGADWRGLMRGPIFGSRHYFLHGRVWYNDPDPVYVRTNLPLKHAQLICSWVALSGQLNLSSEWLPGLPPDRLDLLKRTMPAHGLLPRPVDLFESDPPRVWLLTDTRHGRRRDVVGLFNWADKEATFDEALARIGLPEEEYDAFDYWGNALASPCKGRLRVPVPAQSCAVLSLRPAAAHPQLLSTSRHVTQGMVDVTEETWNEAARELSGSSQVVGNDPYELRILLRTTGGRWTPVSAGIADADRDAGVRLEQKREEDLFRLSLRSPQRRSVRWQVRFAAP